MQHVPKQLQQRPSLLIQCAVFQQISLVNLLYAQNRHYSLFTMHLLIHLLQTAVDDWRKGAFCSAPTWHAMVTVT